MWKTIYIAHTEEQANKIKQLLTENGFLVQLKGNIHQLTIFLFSNNPHIHTDEFTLSNSSFVLPLPLSPQIISIMAHSSYG